MEEKAASERRSVLADREAKHLKTKLDESLPHRPTKPLPTKRSSFTAMQPQRPLPGPVPGVKRATPDPAQDDFDFHS